MRSFVILAVLSALAACSPSASTGPGEADNEGPVAAPGPVPAPGNEAPVSVAENGQTGSAGYACLEASCMDQAQALLKSFERASVPRYSASVCQPGLALGQRVTAEQRFSDPHCLCRDQDGKWQDGPVPGLQGCSVRGRGRRCLWDGPVPECDPGDPKACESTCAELERRWAEDAKGDFEVRVRFAHCASPNCLSQECWSSSTARTLRCNVILEVNGQCHVTDTNGNPIPTPRDCAASDRDLLFPSSDAGPLAAGQAGQDGAAADAGTREAGAESGTARTAP
jgi:hypothetical protein